MLHSDSMRASSTSITGMSSRTGYTRRHVEHFRPFWSPVSFTEVLHRGQTKISRSSCETATHILRSLHCSKAGHQQQIHAAAAERKSQGPKLFRQGGYRQVFTRRASCPLYSAPLCNATGHVARICEP